MDSTTTVAPFKRTTIIAHFRTHEGGARWPVFAQVAWDGRKLSITGVEGPRSNGDCHGSCGQVTTGPEATHHIDRIPEYDRLAEVWDRWHLNDMRAGCEHQRATWNTTEKVEVVTYQLTGAALVERSNVKRIAERRLEAGETVTLTEEERALLALPYTTTTAPDADGPASGRYEVKSREWKAVGWLRESEHPRGLLMKPCEVCGYKYGSAWLHEDVPADVLEFLQSLPDDSRAMPPRWLRD